MPASAPNPRVAQIEQALDTFQDTLGLYRQQLTHWFLRGTDSLSHAADLPSLMGMDRVITLGNARQVVGTGDEEFITSVAQCPANGELVIESKFESVYDVPLGNIEVEVIPVAGGPGTLITLDEQGVGTFRGEAGKFYRLRVQGAVTPEQLDGLFAAYDGLSGELEHWLRGEWQGFKPQWPHSRASALGNGLLVGSWAAIQGVWDGIGQISELLKDPTKLSEKIADSAQATAALAQASPQVMANALLLASDEAALCLLLRTASLWLEALPPSQVTGNTAAAVAEFVVGLLIDLLIGIVLSFFGIGVAYLGVRLVRYGQVIVAAAQRFVAAMFTLVERFMGAAHPYKKLAARGIAPGLKKGRLQLRWDAKRNTTLTPDEPHLNAPNQAKNPNGASADTARHTATHGCPVSMVTGEELLTLTDAELDGLLPFAFTRLYRTSAVELDSGLGFGWSHSLSQRLEINDGTVIWIDPENRRTPFPMPSAERPAIHNSLSRAAIYLGADADELILAQAGDDTPFYHFRDGHLTAISDAYDNRLHIRRDYAGRIQRLDNGAGRALLLRYDRQHLIAIDYQVFEPAPSEAESWRSAQTLVRYHYDARQRLVEVQNALGDSERYQYDDQHVIVQRQLAGGARFFWEWQREGKAARCVRHWASFGQMDSRYTWDDAGSVRVENIDGSEETYVHDAQARQVRRVEADGGEHLKAYDADGHLIAEQDPLGAVTEYRYDAAGRLIARLPPDDQPTAYEYRDGHLYRRTRGKAQWTYRRNPQGDLTEQIDPSGHRTQYYRDAKGRLTSISYPDSSYHAFTWNNLGQLIEEQLPDGAQRQFAYDALGRKIRQQDEHGAVTHYQWDALGRLLHTTLPGGATRAFTYNAYGKVTSEKDERGQVTRYEYDDDLHLISRRLNPDGSQLRYRYDNARLLLSEIENEVGETYRLAYGANGLIEQETGFDGRRTAYAYDLNGHLLEKTEFGADGSTLITAYQRDSAGRLRLKTLPDGAQVEYRYDDLGRLMSVDDGSDWPLAFAYDTQDRLITEHQGWGTLHYGYCAAGHLKHLRLPDHSTLDFQYAPGGILTGIDLNGARLTRHVFDAGREQQRQQGQLLSQYHYDEQGRLQAHALSQPNRPRYMRHYGYTVNGNLASITDSRHGQRNYYYDALNRLTRVQHSRDRLPETFAHDPAGNLELHDRSGRATHKGNRLLRQDDRHYDYDAFGNLIRERWGIVQKFSTEYRYDCQHRLIGVTQPDGRSASYRYDAFGRRIAKTVAGLTSEFFWQGEQVIAENSREHHRSYVYEPGSFRPLAMLDGFGPDKTRPFYYQLDHLGTPQELTDHRGEIVWSATYTAYGKLNSLNHFGGPPLEQPLRFQGQYFDPESGLHYNRHRYYNPATGRYLTPDPSKLAGGVNAYRYTLNPTGWVDPLGLNTCPGGDGCRPKGGVEDPAGKARVDSEDPTYPSRKIDEKHLYRGDSREPWEIFDSGFEPLGESRDLYLHAHDNRNPPSFFVSTTKMPSESVKFATGYGLDLGYIYVMRKVPGIYVNKKLGLLSPHRREIEVAVPGGVSPKDILGATPINADGSHVGYSVLNPNKR